jgi:hypothetical protein
MVNKKYLLLAGLCSVITTGTAFAQESGNQESGSQYSNRDMTYRGDTYDVLDSTFVPKNRRGQHRRYLNHQYHFPAKPKSMWEIGAGGGMYNIVGDVPSLMLWEKGGYGFHGHVRKAWGYTFSTRLQYMYGVGKGLQWQPASNYGNNSAWNGRHNGYAYTAPGDFVFYNYRTEAHQLNLDLIASTNNIRFHRGKLGVAFYGYVGIGANAYQTWVNALNENFEGYQSVFMDVYDRFHDPNTGQIPYAKRKEVKKELRNAMDETYETAAETESGNRSTPIFGKKTLNWVGSAGAGMQVRLSPRFNVALENRLTFFTGNQDLLDGQRWAEQVAGSPVSTPNRDAINYLSLGVNFNLGSKKNVEPLYWLNPLDHVMGELSAPRHMRLPEPVLSDADGDGIADQFDKCPGTPEGVAVDSHGCPLDTDGDGVPDYLDKQLITPTECQPVDADGIGECPCHCDNVAGPCTNISAGNITFAGNNARITSAMQAQLATLAAQMQANPTCKIVLIGQGNASKVQQQRSWDRVNAIQEYMSEKHGIDRNRFIFQYGQPGDPNSVMYRAAQAGEDGPSTVAPPHPQLSNQR